RRKSRAATAKKDRLWPGGIIPYEISTSFSGEHKCIFQQAMRHWEAHTCVTFIPRQDNHTDYIYFTVDKCGCCSYVGRRGGGAQAISIGRNCDKFGIVVHELGHVIGFWHEHTRIDRDDYVTIFYKNIQHGQDYNFDKLKPDDVDSLGEPYDYASIMHYSKDTFSKAPYLNTILPNNFIEGKRPEIGQRYSLSYGDIKQTNKLYHCPACFKTLTAEKESLRLENSSCVWRIIAPFGSFIEINFFPSLWFSNKCAKNGDDYVIVQDGYSSQSPVIGKVCGSEETYTLKSTTNRLYIQAHFSTLPLFSLFATYKIICGGILKANVGTIQSPSYPDYYAPNQDCKWIIEVLENRKVAIIMHHFEFTYGLFFSLQLESYKDCIYDRLEIYEGNTVNKSNLIGRFCGQIKTKIIHSRGNTVLLHFHSDNSIQKAGFHIKQNECKSLGFQVCEQVCIVEIDGYRCDCNAGYSLRSDGKTCEVACGGYLKAESGSFFSPNYPLDYPPSANCTWEIETKSGYQIVINFTHFDVEGMKTECGYDYVEERYCGFYDELLVYTSTSNYLKVQFVSDTTVGKSGFAAYFMADLDECQNNKGGCEQICINTIGSYRCECDIGFVLAVDGKHCKEGGCKFQLHASEGEITSPGYPLDYPNAKLCQWHIVTTPGHRLAIGFEDFVLENHAQCKYDRLEFFDGGSNLSKLLGVYCGNIVPRKIYATRNEIFISFSSDESVVRRGFKAFYSSVCGGELKADETVGYVYSHSHYGDDKYGKNLRCEWRILAPPKKGVQVKFLQFDFESDLNCAFDFVEVFDGWEKSDSKLLGRFCGEMVSFFKKLLILLSTDDTEERKGFMAEYRSALPRISSINTTYRHFKESLINNG
uniref:Metalloendopeptidase n=1 Tax=Syphacia muris TaxID=451379 RepID=A0A0N5A821_9BILA